VRGFLIFVIFMAMKIVLTESQFKRLIKEDEEPKKPVFSKEKWLYEPTNYKPIKKGEQWFYEPFNQCLRNLAEREKNVILAGHTACYENDFGDNICYEARFSKDDKGGYMRTPSFFKKYSYAVQLSLNEYLEPGEWWCEAGRKEPKVDLSKTLEHRERMKHKEKNLQKSIADKKWMEMGDSNKKTTSKIPQANTIDDIRNGNGYIIKGMEGPIVKELQKKLLSLKYDLGSTKDDGVFGQYTEDAITKFQKDHNITPKNNIYGRFGKITYEKLLKVLKDKGLDPIESD
jgi:hypothetical protein